MSPHLPRGGECVFPHAPPVYFMPMIQSAFLRRAGACLTVMLLAAIAHADEGATHGPQARHVHGSAQLNLAAEGRLVFVELISPAANLVGFEHAPESDAEHAARQSAFSTLEDADRLFQFDQAADCRAEQAEIASDSAPTAQPTDRAAHHRHAEGKEQHGDTHHADITANYRFVCAAPEGPASLRVGLFEAFPAINDLVVQYVTDSRQGGTTLSSSEPVLRF